MCNCLGRCVRRKCSWCGQQLGNSGAMQPLAVDAWLSPASHGLENRRRMRVPEAGSGRPCVQEPPQCRAPDSCNRSTRPLCTWQCVRVCDRAVGVRIGQDWSRTERPLPSAPNKLRSLSPRVPLFEIRSALSQVTREERFSNGLPCTLLMSTVRTTFAAQSVLCPQQTYNSGLYQGFVQKVRFSAAFPSTTSCSSEDLHVFRGTVPLHSVLAEHAGRTLIGSVTTWRRKLESSRTAGKVRISLKKGGWPNYHFPTAQTDFPA